MRLRATYKLATHKFANLPSALVLTVLKAGQTGADRSGATGLKVHAEVNTEADQPGNRDKFRGDWNYGIHSRSSQ
jgi:hypothetical protein